MPVVEVSEGDGDAVVEAGVGETVFPVGTSEREVASSGLEIFSFVAPGVLCLVTATSRVAFLTPPCTHSPRTRQD